MRWPRGAEGVAPLITSPEQDVVEVSCVDGGPYRESYDDDEIKKDGNGARPVAARQRGRAR